MSGVRVQWDNSVSRCFLGKPAFAWDGPEPDLYPLYIYRMAARVVALTRGAGDARRRSEAIVERRWRHGLGRCRGSVADTKQAGDIP